MKLAMSNSMLVRFLLYSRGGWTLPSATTRSSLLFSMSVTLFSGLRRALKSHILTAMMIHPNYFITCEAESNSLLVAHCKMAMVRSDLPDERKGIAFVSILLESIKLIVFVLYIMFVSETSSDRIIQTSLLYPGLRRGREGKWSIKQILRSFLLNHITR